MLTDNCSAHGSLESIPPIDNVEILFLPPNSTSKLQPLDAEIIATLKIKYRKIQYEHALDRIDSGISNIYHLQVDQLTAMQWMRNTSDQHPKKSYGKLLKTLWFTAVWD